MVAGLAVGPSAVYWIGFDREEWMLQMGGPGIATTTLAAPLSPAGSGLAIDSSYLYWAEQGDPVSPAGAGTILRYPLAGGFPEVLASGRTSPTAPAVDSQSVYWVEGGAIYAVPLGGGAVATVAPVSAGAVAVAADGTNVYWVTGSVGAVVQQSLATGSQTVLATNQGTVDFLAVDSTTVYWAPQSGTAETTPINGGQVTPLATGPAQELAVADGSVYWLTPSGDVEVMPVGGGGVTHLASGRSLRFGSPIAIGPAGLYWVDDDGVSVAGLGTAATCSNGVCACGGNATLCGSCVDTSTDPDNCGGCGIACGDSACAAGSCCIGDGGINTCGGACVNQDTDPLNCGGCGLSCGALETALAATFELGGQVGMTTDRTNLYWTSFGPSSNTGSVWKLPLSGGTPRTLASGQSFPYGIVADATGLTWVNEAPGDAGAIMRVPLDGGVARSLVGPLDVPYQVASDGTYAYWTQPHDGLVARAPLDGGTPEVLASGQAMPSAIAVDGRGVYWTNRGTAANTYLDGTVEAFLFDGGATITLATAQYSPTAMVLTGGRLFWNAAPSLMEASTQGGPAGRVAFNMTSTSLATDGTDLFFGGDTLYRVSVAGGAVGPVVNGTSAADQYPGPMLAVPGQLVFSDSTAIYTVSTTDTGACQGGVCACAGAGTYCTCSVGGGCILGTGTCRDLTTDPEYCGTCNPPRDTDAWCEACTNGSCTSCPGHDNADCPGDGGFDVCVSLQSDESDCGVCGHPCSAGETCSNGVCG